MKKMTLIMSVIVMISLCGCGIKDGNHVSDEIKKETGSSKEKMNLALRCV